MFDFLASYCLKGMAGLIQWLPISLSLTIARAIGSFVYFFDKRRFIAYANIKAAFPGKYSASEIKSITHRSYRHFAQVFFEILYFPKMDLNFVKRYIKNVDYDYYKKVTSGSSGVMFMAAHAGNWELLQIYSGIVGHPMRVLVREQKLSRLNTFLNELRSSHGSRPVFSKGFEIRELIRGLKQKEIVGVLGDQGGGRHGTIVRLFGRKITAPNGVMAMAQRTGAKVVPSFSVRVKGPFHQIHITPELELVRTGNGEDDDALNCRKYLERLEKFVTKHPDEWLWMHKRWKFCFTKRVLILEDEKMGHASQARSVAAQFQTVFEKLSLEYEVDFKSVRIRFKSRLHEMFFFVFSLAAIPFAQSRLSLLKWFFDRETAKELQNIPHVDFVVSCGSKLAPLNLWIRREYLAKSVVVMKPAFPYDRMKYDLVILPKHDQTGQVRSNRFETLISPNLVNPDLLEQAANQLKHQVPLNGKPKLSIFIGGNTKKYRFKRKSFEAWIDSLKQAAEEYDFDFMMTTSRRTSREMDGLLKQAFQNEPRCKLLVIANEKNIENVTYGMLALSDIAVVTEDSVSMVSEALSANKRVIVLRLGNQKLSKKHRRFQEILTEERLIYVATSNDFPVKLQATCSESHPAAMLVQNEREKIGEALRRLV